MQALAFVRLFLAIWQTTLWPYSLAKHFGDGFDAGESAIIIFPGRDRL